MRAGAAAVVAVLSALIGGVGALAIARSLDWVGETETVVLPAAADTGATAPPPPPPAAPLPAGAFDPARIYAERSPGVVTIYARFRSGGESQGTGFVVDDDGTILTNAHVITNAGEVPASAIRAADQLFVQFADRDRAEAEVVGWDVFDDVGVIRVAPDAHALSPLPLGDSDAVQVGEPVAAIGSPFDNVGSLSVGIVSATRRGIDSLTSDYQLVDAIQTDAPINRGNSGGPLFDGRGLVIGINAQIRSTSGSNEGVGFAVPINAAKRSLDELLEDGRVDYAYVGISTVDLTASLAQELGYATATGAVVTSVCPGSPGDGAGLRPGGEAEAHLGREVPRDADVIVAIGEVPIDGAEDVVRVVAQQLRPGQTVRFTVQRGTRRVAVPVKVAERPLDQNRC